MKRYLPKNAEDASALILTLLVIVLLSAIVVSFLSSTRTELQATRNYTSKVKAEMLANSATHQAMAKIQQGFNTTNATSGSSSANHTQIVTTQPGLIAKYFFLNGTCTGNATTALYTENGTTTSNATAYLNNLESPSSSANATSSQWTITGNASERINVFMENVTATVNGTNQTVGRIAYYVDDEGAKLNLNAATGDRPTLNVGSSRSLSLSTLVSAAQATNFTQTINGTTNTPTSIQTWAHFFRPEQLAGLFGGNAAISGNLSKFSAAPVVGSDYHFKKTPWGTDRLFINDLPIDSANATASVNKIYEALSGKNATTGNLTADQGLRNIYGTTFAEKYTDVGLKQIAANILQARQANVLNDPTKSFTYNGSLLGATNATTDLSFPSRSLLLLGTGGGGAAPQNFIPKDYLGNVPYPILNEIGVTVVAGYRRDKSPSDPVGVLNLFLLIRPFVSISNPWPATFSSVDVDKWKIEMQVDSFTYDIEHQVGNSTADIYTYGPRGYKNGEPFGRNVMNESKRVFTNIDNGKPANKLSQAAPMGPGRSYYLMNGTAMVGFGSGGIFSSNLTAPSYKKDLAPGEELQFPCPPHIELPEQGTDLYNKSGGVRVTIPQGVKILDIFNMRIKFEYIRLLAVDGDDRTIRDWMLGPDGAFDAATGEMKDVEIECSLQKPINMVASKWGVSSVNWPKGFLEDPWSDGLVNDSRPYNQTNEKVVPTIDQIKPPEKSIKRIGGALKPSVNTLPIPTPSPTPTSSPSPTPSQRPSMLAWSVSGNATWVSSNASGNASSISTTGDPEAYPSKTKDNEIPGDPTKTDSDLRYAFEPREHHLDSNDWPKIEFTNPANSTGVFTSPADLGKIQTNIQHRKLRFTIQHPNEVAVGNGGLGNATYIPDWAMLDVISFGSNVTTMPLPAPVNLNGRFHVPSGSPQPLPRTAGLESALKAIDSATLLGNSFNASFTPPTDRSQYMGSSVNVSSTVAANIGNLTWSIGNFTTGNSTWGKGNSTNDDPGGIKSRRKTAGFPTGQFVLPAEVTEIRGVSDVAPLDNYTGNSTHIKANEGRLSSLFPGATTQSRFFTIYAYAQALDRQGQPDSEAVTKTLVEVEEQTPVTTPPTYKVKKLYTQPISVQ